MKIKLILNLIALLICSSAFSQDTLNLYFKKSRILWLKSDCKIDLVDDDPNFSEKIIKVEDDKFFYVKSNDDDKLPVEFGSLGLYTILNKPYLLREGFWILKDSSVKIMFSNSAKIGIPEEMIISSTPIWYDDKRKKNRKKGIRSSKILYKTEG